MAVDVPFWSALKKDARPGCCSPFLLCWGGLVAPPFEVYQKGHRTLFLCHGNALARQRCLFGPIQGMVENWVPHDKFTGNGNILEKGRPDLTGAFVSVLGWVSLMDFWGVGMERVINQHLIGRWTGQSPHESNT